MDHPRHRLPFSNGFVPFLPAERRAGAEKAWTLTVALDVDDSVIETDQRCLNWEPIYVRDLWENVLRAELGKALCV